MRGEQSQVDRPLHEEGDLGGQEEDMNSPPTTPGHDSNSDDPDLITLDRVVASLRTKLAAQRSQDRVAGPGRIEELQRQLEEEKAKCSQLEKDRQDITDSCVHAESRASFFAMENEQLKVIAEANSEALNKSREECKRLTDELAKARADLMRSSEEVHRKQMRLDNLERTVAQLKSELASQEAALQEALDTIKTPAKLTTTHEVQKKLAEGSIAIRQVKSLQDQFQEWKLRYKDVVPASVRTEKIALEKDIDGLHEELKAKEQEAHDLEQSTVAVKSLWNRVYMAGLSTPTLYNIFLYEYTHIKIQVAKPQMWQETSMANQ